MTAAAPALDERPAATLPLPNGFAYVVAAVAVIAALLLPFALLAGGVSLADAVADYQLNIVAVVAPLGAVILRRRPGHVIGWVLVAAGGVDALIQLSAAYRLFGLPSGAAVADLFYLLWLPGAAGFFIALPQLFPDGRLLSRRWRPLAWFGAAVTGLLTTLFALAPEPWFEVAFPLFGAAAVASLVPLVVRFRRSTGEQRQQTKWVVYGLAVSVPIAAIHVLVDTRSTAGLTLVPIVVVPVAVTVAVLRYRLYDIDLVINKTVVFVALAAFITAVYAGIVVGLGRLLPIGGGLELSIAATALVAVAFEPVRARVQHAANHLVYGRRASPYEALATMTTHLADTTDPDTGLAVAARLLAEGTGAASAAVWVARDGRLVPVATSGAKAEPNPVPLPDDGLPSLPGADLTTPVHSEGQLVGALSLTKRPGEGVSTADRKLVRELAGQATLLLANTRLRARLRERLDELRASRQRLLAAQDQARHRLERDLHDGAQQEIVACKITIGLAKAVAAKEGATRLTTGLDDAAATADQIVDGLREIARGIYPPLLESEGLVAALAAQARRAPLDVRMTDRDVTRYPREIEATTYFCAVEALHNAVRHARAAHARVELDGTGPTLTLTVTDDGAGFDPDHTPTATGTGLAHMTDRADATGGTLTITSHPGHGTTITLALPTPAPVTASEPPPAGIPHGAGVDAPAPADPLVRGSLL